MQIHHLNCGAMQPYGGSLFDGQTPGLGPAELTCHCLLLETDAGPVLIDTGTTASDPDAAGAALDPTFRTIDRVRLTADEAAANQARALGHAPETIAHIVMTHLDFDHAAGLVDFPAARVHLSAAEARAARTATGPKATRRYRPAQFGSSERRWHTYGRFPETWFGLPAAAIDGVPGVMLVPLPGHTPGHCGVAIQTGGGWLLHAADAIFNHRELATPPSTPTAARVYQWMMQTSQTQRRRSLHHLRRIAREHPEIRIICTHDPALLPG